MGTLSSTYHNVSAMIPKIRITTAATPPPTLPPIISPKFDSVAVVACVALGDVVACVALGDVVACVVLGDVPVTEKYT